MWIGKLIGTVLGFLLGNYFGAFIGFIAGNAFDQGLADQYRVNPQRQTYIQKVFFRITFQVMGHIAKADGRISEDEIKLARTIMQRMQLNTAQKKQAIQYFTQGKQKEFNLLQALDELYQTCQQQHLLLRMFIEIQFQAALADGAIGPNKQKILNIICQRLGFTQYASGYESIFGGSYQRQHSYQQRPSPRTSLDADYKLLNVKKTANKSEIKKAYRRLMSQHHPDKLIAQGLPEEMIRLATDKTQEIQAAYERICQARWF